MNLNCIEFLKFTENNNSKWKTIYMKKLIFIVLVAVVLKQLEFVDKEELINLLKV